MQRSGGPQVVIIGAGPAGLATAYFLKKRGYQNVLVLEKLGRVGGLCDTMTCQGFSFDLGANYVTPAYKQVLRMAGEVGAKFYSERPFTAMTVPTDGSAATFTTMFDAVRVDDATGRTIGALPFLWLMAKYTWIRWRLAGIIDRPTFAGVERHAQLCEPFGLWLKDNGLSQLTRLFELPVTMMGYGTIHATPAIYALKFMTVNTFLPMAMKEAPYIGKWLGWPKRFVKGFQRFWETVSWDLEVRCNVTVTKVVREQGRPTVVHYVQKEQELDRFGDQQGVIECDYLVLACPQGVLLGRKSIIRDPEHRPPDTGSFLDLTEEERRLFDQVREVWYCMITHQVQSLSVGGGAPLAAIYPLAPVLHPRGVAKQWEACDLVQYYSPISSDGIYAAMLEAEREARAGVPGAEERYQELEKIWTDMCDPDCPHDPVKEPVLKYVRQTTAQMGGVIENERHEWHTYNRFVYFQHVGTESLKDGFYTDLEKLQGKHNTFYVGGATNFELVEPIVEYAKNLVETHFPAVR
jgi:hypothetical protein